MNRIRKPLLFQNLLCAFLFALPFVEMYRSFFGDTLSLFGFAAEELFLLSWVGILFAGAVWIAWREGRKKTLLASACLLAVLLVYTLLHDRNAALFDAALIPDGNPNFLSEAYYTLRMYLAPTLLLLSGILLRLPKEKLFSAMRVVLWILSLSIVIPCLFGISFASYEEGNECIRGGYLSWLSFDQSTDFSAYCAKGFFSRANVISAVLFALTPFAAKGALERGKIRDHTLLFLTGLASITVGTKIASFGFFLSLGAMLFCRLLECLLQKKSEETRAMWKKLGISLGVFLLLLPIFLLSPGLKWQLEREDQKETDSRPLEHFAIVEEFLEKSENAALSQEDAKILADYVEENGWDHYIDPWFPSLYPVENDPEFWLEILSRDPRENQDARRFKLELCARILSQNENRGDVLFGMGFTSGIPYAERDFVFQYYQFGLVGVILLLLPFLGAFFYGIFTFLKALMKKKPLLCPAVCCLSLFSFFVTAYLAGHVFDALFSTYFVAAVSIGASPSERT